MLERNLPHRFCISLVVFLGLVLWTKPLLAQNPLVDSLETYLEEVQEDTNKVNALNDLAFHLHPSEPRRTIVLSDQAISLSEKLRYQRGLARAHNHKGIGYWYVGEYDSAITFFERAFLLYGEINDKKGQSAILNNVGNLYRIQGNYPRAIENYQKSLKIDEERRDTNGVAISMVNIGLIYKNQEDWEKAMNYYSQALEIFQTRKNEFGIGVVKNNIGEVLESSGRPEQSLSYYYEAIATLNKINAFCRAVFSELGMGTAYMKLNEVDSARFYYQLSLDKGRSCENPYIITQSLLGLGQTMLYENELAKAESYYKQAYVLAYEKKLLKPMGVAANNLSRIYEKMNKNDLALEYFKIFHESNDSLLNEDKIKEIARIEYEYKIDKERASIALDQEKKDLLYTAELKRERLLKQVYIGVSFIVLLIAFVYYQQYARKKKSARLFEEKTNLIMLQNQKITKSAQQLTEAHNELKDLSHFKEGLTHMIAHDMKNSLNVILGLSDSEKNNKKMNLISQSGRMLHNLVLNMLQAQKFEEVGIELNLEPCRISEVLEEAQKQVQLFLKMSATRLEVDLAYDPVIDVDKEIMTRVWVNLLTNAIKYSPPMSTIKMATALKGSDPEFLSIRVVDQGEGISPEKLPYIFDKFWNDTSPTVGKSASTGLGLTFCKLAVEAHKGRVRAESDYGNGATFIVELPVDPKRKEPLQDKQYAFTPAADKAEFDEADESVVEFKNKLQQIEVHQISVLYQLLAEIEESPWKQRLKAAILFGDEEEYKRLIRL